jgi:hypothetical protein
MSARENLLRKSCRAPADNHFIYVSHRQHSCGKKDLYQRFFTTDENVTLSPNTRLQQLPNGSEAGLQMRDLWRGRLNKRVRIISLDGSGRFTGKSELIPRQELQLSSED